MNSVATGDKSAGKKDGTGHAPVGVLLINLGGPDSLAAIQPFLYNLFSDREIIRLRPQRLMAKLISSRRAKKVAERYRQIGGRSPILPLTMQQGRALGAKLNARRSDYRIYVGMRYWRPFIGEAVRQAVDEGVSRLVVLPLFPQYSRATTGSCLGEVKRVLRRLETEVEVTFVESWYDEPLYLDALAERIREGLDQFPQRELAHVQVVFSAHSLPEKFVAEGDPYVDHLKKTIAGVVDRLAPLNWVLTFQSRSGPVKWLEPQTDRTIADLAKSGCEYMLVVPISFVSDHIETLYEIDIMYRELAEANGVRLFVRSPALNSSPAFIEALADIVRRHVRAGRRQLAARMSG